METSRPVATAPVPPLSGRSPARLVYTRSGLVSLSDIPIRRSSDVTSPFPPSGNEGYIRNRDVKSVCSVRFYFFINQM